MLSIVKGGHCKIYSDLTFHRFLKIWAHFLLRKKPGFAGFPSRRHAA
jgi:hypothetical protein